MIRPPFTILIVKDGHQPLTVRITRRIALTGMVTLLFLTGIIIYGIYWHSVRFHSSAYHTLIPDSNESSTYTVDEETVSENEVDTEQTQLSPVIDDLSVDQISENSVEIGFTITNPPAEKELYVWIILNGEMSPVIYPRSPLFHGMPVDYRNGIRYYGNNSEPVRAEFNNMKIGIDFDSFRILAYETGDSIVLDKTYTIQHPDNM